MSTFLKLISAVLISCSSVFAADVPTPAGTAALVNGAIITTAEYSNELARVLRLRKKNVQDLDTATLALTKKEALETLIGRELLYQQSQREGISVKDAEVEAEISVLRKQFPTEEDFNASLAKLGLTRDVVRAQIRRGMAIQALTNMKFDSRSAVTEPEIRSYFDNHPDEFLASEQETVAVRPKTPLPYEAVREKIGKKLQRERILIEVRHYLKQLREAARVEIHLAGE